MGLLVEMLLLLLVEVLLLFLRQLWFGIGHANVPQICNWHATFSRQPDLRWELLLLLMLLLLLLLLLISQACPDIGGVSRIGRRASVHIGITTIMQKKIEICSILVKI